MTRSLKACEGAVLIVDATQGIQAQTVANYWLAFEVWWFVFLIVEWFGDYSCVE